LQTIREHDEASQNDRSELIDNLVFDNDAHEDILDRELLGDPNEGRICQTEKKNNPNNPNTFGIGPANYKLNISKESPLREPTKGKHQRINSNPFELSSQVGNASSSDKSGKFSGTSSFL